MALVLVARNHDSIQWMEDVHSEEWTRYTYIASEDTNPNNTLHVPANKGNEVMRYLSFIIDNYDSLPNIIAFRHGHEHAWHQEFDSAAQINNLNLTTVRSRRYQNFDCVFGREQHMYLAETQRKENASDSTIKKSLSTRSDPPVNAAIYEYWDAFFGTPMPEDLTASCCAQFVVVKEAVYSRPKEKHMQWRQWLLATNLENHHSGMVFERLWHVIFGMPPVLCPADHDCPCNVYTGPLAQHCPS